MMGFHSWAATLMNLRGRKNPENGLNVKLPNKPKERNSPAPSHRQRLATPKKKPNRFKAEHMRKRTNSENYSLQ